MLYKSSQCVYFPVSAKSLDPLNEIVWRSYRTSKLMIQNLFKKFYDNLIKIIYEKFRKEMVHPAFE